MRRIRNKYTLVVIDVQPEFEDSAKPVLKAVEDEMLLAMDRQMPILLVEYKNSGDTLLRPVIGSYRKCYIVTKDQTGGSRQVKAALRKHNLPRQWLRVCGVNTDCCVYYTVEGMKKVPIIQIVEKACWSNWDETGSPANHNAGIRLLAGLPNVVIDTSPSIKVA